MIKSLESDRNILIMIILYIICLKYSKISQFNEIFNQIIIKFYIFPRLAQCLRRSLLLCETQTQRPKVSCSNISYKQHPHANHRFLLRHQSPILKDLRKHSAFYRDQQIHHHKILKLARRGHDYKEILTIKYDDLKQFLLECLFYGYPKTSYSHDGQSSGNIACLG